MRDPWDSSFDGPEIEAETQAAGLQTVAPRDPWDSSYDFEPVPQEEEGIVEASVKGLAHGTLGMAESLGTGIRYLGTKIGSEGAQDFGKTVEQYWKEAAAPYRASQPLQGSVLEDPDLLAKGSWWAYNLGGIVPTLAASIIPGVATQKAIGALYPKLAKLGGALAGGAVGGGLEGANTYREVIEKGGSEEEAASAMEMMTLASGALNALSVDRFLKSLPSDIRGQISARTLRGLTEGITEWLEGPAEAGILYEGGFITPEEAAKKMKDELNVAGPAAVAGFFFPGAGQIPTVEQGKKGARELIEPSDILKTENVDDATAVMDEVVDAPVTLKGSVEEYFDEKGVLIDYEPPPEIQPGARFKPVTGYPGISDKIKQETLQMAKDRAALHEELDKAVEGYPGMAGSLKKENVRLAKEQGAEAEAADIDAEMRGVYEADKAERDRQIFDAELKAEILAHDAAKRAKETPADVSKPSLQTQMQEAIEEAEAEITRLKEEEAALVLESGRPFNPDVVGKEGGARQMPKPDMSQVQAGLSRKIENVGVQLGRLKALQARMPVEERQKELEGKTKAAFDTQMQKAMAEAEAKIKEETPLEKPVETKAAPAEEATGEEAAAVAVAPEGLQEPIEVTPEEAAAETRHRRSEAAKKRHEQSKVPTGEEPLSHFLAKTRPMDPTDSELDPADRRHMRVGVLRTFKKGGESIDGAMEWANQNGWSFATLNDFKRALREEAAGRPQYSAKGQEAAAAREYAEREYDAEQAEAEFDAIMAETEAKAPAEELELTQQTEEGLKAQNQAEKDRAKAKKEAEQKAKADEELAGFVLAGSERESDQVAARGQRELAEHKEGRDIGDKVWFKGDEVTVTTEPYEKFGGKWQDAVKENGDVVTLITEEQREANDAKREAERKEQQAGAARLHALQTEQKAEAPDISNIPGSRVQAKKQADGKYKLFYTGTRNEVFPGETFSSSQKARSYFKAEQAKQKPKAVTLTKDIPISYSLTYGDEVVTHEYKPKGKAAKGNETATFKDVDSHAKALVGRIEQLSKVLKCMRGA